MNTLVIDSSVIIKWLNRTNENYIKQADKILDDTRNGKVELIAPELAKYEIGNVFLTGKKLTPTQAHTSLATSYSLPLQFVEETLDIAVTTFEIAYKWHLTYYDAAFLAVAKQYNATLVTENIKHQGKTSNVNVIALKDY